MVNHEDNKALIDNELIKVKRGSKITSVRQLCDRWGWSNTKVKNFLKLLQSDGMLIAESDKETMKKHTNNNMCCYLWMKRQEQGKVTCA
ncbi:MAG: hypothetical protein JJT76_14785 [Clostridiaceae bacterium]|nr:hypothetical protein [Clostridiaceae bacterium]